MDKRMPKSFWRIEEVFVQPTFLSSSQVWYKLQLYLAISNTMVSDVLVQEKSGSNTLSIYKKGNTSPRNQLVQS